MKTISILGASGYAGGEILRILINNPGVKIKQVTSRQFSGQPVSLAHPNLRKLTDLVFIRPDQLESCDVLFVALPNGASMDLMMGLSKKAKKIIDLGADFRLHKSQVFESWYRKKHTSPHLLDKFVYGIAELHRSEIAKSSFIACAGCEATVSILALYPL